MPLMWEYPPEILAILTQPPSDKELARRKVDQEKREAEQQARDLKWKADRAAEEEIRRDKESAWEWCRANGNPHRSEDPTLWYKWGDPTHYNKLLIR